MCDLLLAGVPSNCPAAGPRSSERPTAQGRDESSKSLSTGPRRRIRGPDRPQRARWYHCLSRLRVSPCMAQNVQHYTQYKCSCDLILEYLQAGDGWTSPKAGEQCSPAVNRGDHSSPSVANSVSTSSHDNNGTQFPPPPSAVVKTVGPTESWHIVVNVMMLGLLVRLSFEP